MAIKLADTARPNNYVDAEHLGTYPVAYAEDVWFADGTRLSEKDFSGGNIQKTELPLASEDELGKIYQFIGATGTYINGYWYKCIETPDSDPTTYEWEQVPYAWDVQLTQAEYDALPNGKETDNKTYYVIDGKADDTVVYGWTIDPDESDSFDCVTYTDDAVGMSPASMGATSFNYGSWEDAFFIPRPCMLKLDGTVDYYLNPNDYSLKEDGTPSDISNPEYTGNAMMEWGVVWFKFPNGVASGAGSFSCSNKQVDETYDCPCNKDADGNFIPHFYTAIYNATGTEIFKSKSGIQLTPENGSGNTTGAQEIRRAVLNNTTGKYEWITDVWCDRVLINALLILMSHSIDSQASFGRGLDGEVANSPNSQSIKESYITGTLDNKGLFWGDTNHGLSPVKVFGMENWWGCCWRRIAGLLGIQGRYIYKMTQPYSQTGHGYIDSNISIVNSGDISKCSFGEFGYVPIEVQGTVNSYYADTFHHNLDETRTYYGVVGDCTSSGKNTGMNALGLHVYWDTVHWSCSTTLSCKPLASRFN